MVVLSLYIYFDVRSAYFELSGHFKKINQNILLTSDFIKRTSLEPTFVQKRM